MTPSPYIPSLWLKQLLFNAKELHGLEYFTRFDQAYRDQYANYTLDENGDPPLWIMGGMIFTALQALYEMQHANFIREEQLSSIIQKSILGDPSDFHYLNPDSRLNRAKILINGLMSMLTLMRVRDEEGNWIINYHSEEFLNPSPLSI